jgi:hypothetical protein
MAHVLVRIDETERFDRVLNRGEVDLGLQQFKFGFKGVFPLQALTFHGLPRDENIADDRLNKRARRIAWLAGKTPDKKNRVKTVRKTPETSSPPR